MSSHILEFLHETRRISRSVKSSFSISCVVSLGAVLGPYLFSLLGLRSFILIGGSGSVGFTSRMFVGEVFVGFIGSPCP